jgi:glycogen(starch) synthase
MASTADLIIEDFGAPFSSVAVPLFTLRPVIGSVQWLFAHEKSKQYHLPFHWVQAIGVASHQEFIAVSSDLGQVLSTTNDSARVHVIGNGVDLTPGVSVGDRDFGKGGIRYLGRLEVAQKGLDMLLEAYQAIAGDISQDLIIGGDGPDEDLLIEQARQAGLADRVRFVGRVSAAERLSFLAGADVVAIPSRYETFGMVAAESLAAGSPVVAFDIPCLRALVDESVGVSVAAFDIGEFGATLRRLCQNPSLRRSLGEAGPARVADLNWDRLAEMQGQVYRDTLTRAGSREREVEVSHA